MAIDTTEQTDAALLSAFERGDAASFEQLFGRHRRGVYGFCLGLCGDEQLAADAAQDTWLAVIEQPGRFAAARSLKAYLYRAARNRVIELQRAGNRARRAAAAVPVLVRPAAGGDPEQAGRLNQALLDLPEEQREVVLLRIYESMKFAEIAEVTGAGLKTVESRHRLALARLQQWLAGDEP